MPSIVIIIGAGAAGLLAARQLSEAGLMVTLLEAAAQPGGRMHTLENGFAGPAEAGAEFIHGELEWSLQLAREAGIPLHPVRAGMVRVKKGKWSGDPMATEGWVDLMKKMAALEEHKPLSRFLDRIFACVTT